MMCICMHPRVCVSVRIHLSKDRTKPSPCSVNNPYSWHICSTNHCKYTTLHYSLHNEPQHHRRCQRSYIDGRDLWSLPRYHYTLGHFSVPQDGIESWNNSVRRTIVLYQEIRRSLCWLPWPYQGTCWAFHHMRSFYHLLKNLPWWVVLVQVVKDQRRECYQWISFWVSKDGIGFNYGWYTFRVLGDESDDFLCCERLSRL